jgi:hypothetical protein
MKTRWIVVGAVVAASFTSPSTAGTLRLAVKDVTTVQDGLGNSRVFFGVADPGNLGRRWASAAPAR